MTTDATQPDWQARITALPTQADIDDCKALWPHDWREKHAFYDGQVAALLNVVARLRERHGTAAADAYIGWSDDDGA